MSVVPDSGVKTPYPVTLIVTTSLLAMTFKTILHNPRKPFSRIANLLISLKSCAK